jgi:hypothetical protein
MADFNEFNDGDSSGENVTIVDSNNPTRKTIVTANGDLLTDSILNVSGLEGAIVVGTTAVAARVGGANLTDRKVMTIHNNSNSTIYYGYNNTVTTSSGTPIFKNERAIFSVGSNLTVWLIAGSGGNNIRITEAK